ncbi:MAG: hypothetical protein Q8904_12525 [Bacteroidota bacterium]|nr:hypothetical protein [Bacteroidota bacterium]
MKTSRYLSAILLFFLGAASSLQAQDTILNRNVSVEREYRPVIHDAGKINSMPQVLDPDVVKSPAYYSDFNLPLNAGYNIHPLQAAGLAPEKHVNGNNGYARLGVGNYLNTLADFAYPVINTSDTRLDFSLNHLATFETKRMHTTTKANLSFDKIFKTFDLYAGVGGGHEHFKYYGDYFNSVDSTVNLNMLASKYNLSNYIEKSREGINSTPTNTLSVNPDDETFRRFNVMAGVRSLPMATDLRYQAGMQYELFSSINGLTENLVHTQVGFCSPSEKNRLGMDFELYNLIYSSNKIQKFNFWKNYSVLTLNPYYSIERPDYTVRLGLKSSQSFVHGKFMNPSADVRAEWKAIPEYLSLYGGLTGDFEVNTLNKIMTENPYLFSDLRLTDTYTPVDLFAGIKLKPLYNLSLDAYIDYKQIDNQYFYVNKGYSLNHSTGLQQADTTIYSNRFNVVYSNASHFKMGIRANYTIQDLVNVEFKWAYNGWNVDNQQYAWNMPKYETQLNTSVRINNNFNVSANLFYDAVRFAKLGDVAVPMHDKVDINLGASYSYNNWLTFFGKINNLINNHYQNYYGYDVQGTNLMIGAMFSF